ncbi:MAG: NAD(P)-dependent oxidoreductase [Hyphomicrobiaceae bacterium]
MNSLKATGRTSTNQLSPIGFIGLGRMGHPMARNLVGAGFEVLANDQNPDVAARFRDTVHVDPMNDLSELAQRARVLITMLPTSQIVRDVLIGEHGIAANLRPGAIVVDMSTSDPNDTRSLGTALADHGIALVDAPVAGGVVFAEDGSLDILTAGQRATVDRLAPIFSSVGRKTFYCGALGAAHAMKALNNYVNAAVMSIYMEALVAGKRFGLEDRTMREALEAATLDRNHPYHKKIRKQVFTRTFDSRMELGLIAKDLDIATSIARSVDMEVPLANAVSELWSRAANELGGDVDQTEIVRFWERRAEVELDDGQSR